MRVQILQNNQTLSQFRHKSKLYLMAPSSGEYEIELTNDTPGRVEAVVSVDGLSVMTGETASKQQRGYVLNPGQIMRIPGWRRNESEVARFTFGEKEASYSAQMGKGTQNTSVIGVAVFTEKVPQVLFRTPIIIEKHVPYPVPTSPFWYGTGTAGPMPDSTPTVTCSTEPIGARYSSVTRGATKTYAAEDEPRRTSAALDLGTGYGSQAAFVTQGVSFERASRSPIETITIRYATREKLIEWGVPVEQPVMAPEPNPFPVGCPAPAGWNG